MLIGGKFTQISGKLLQIYQKQGFINIEFLCEKGLLRLAAQKESDKAQNGLLLETCCISYVHKDNYIYEVGFCKCFL